MKRGATELASMMRLLDEALDLPEDSRLSWVEKLPEAYAELRPSLRRLLMTPAAIETDDAVNLQSRIADVLYEEIHASTQAELHQGMRIGPYELERELGRGGMGSVWLAHRADGAFRRSMALKLPHLTWMGNFAQRMVRERDILAQLQHENIAGFLDAGIDDLGRPYLAMEYVEGKPIDQFCRDNALPVNARLRLLLEVAQGLTHAHSKLVVHRDLKPSNILVTAAGEVRLVDFGVAALVSPEGAQPTRITQFAGRPLTLQYASPEQVRGERTDTSTDIYSLAVVAFELLTGSRPYRLKRGTAAELEQAIADADPLPASESVHDRAVKRALRGDLDAVLNMAMKKDPRERYPTIEAFGDDLQRHLNDLPVRARADRFVYRARKFLVRNALQVTAAAAVLAAILAGSGVALWQAHGARQEAARAEATKNFLVEIFRSNDVRIASDKPHAERTVKEVLDVATGRIGEQFAHDPTMQLELLGLAATIYKNQQDLPRYREMQRQRMTVARALYGPDHPVVIDGLLGEADTALDAADSVGGARLLAEADAALTRSGANATAQRANWLRIKVRLLHSTTNDQYQSDQLLQQALALYRRLGVARIDYADALASQAHVEVDRGVPARAVPLMREAIRIAELAPERDDAFMSGLQFDLARKLEDAGDFGGAEEAYARAQALARSTFGVHHRNYWWTVAFHAGMLNFRGERERAGVLFDELQANVPTPPDSYDAASAIQQYADYLTDVGNARAAIPLLEAAYRTFQRDHLEYYDLFLIRSDLGNAYDQVGRTADAREMLIEARENILGHEDQNIRDSLRIRERWARFLMDHSSSNRSDVAMAEAEYRHVLDMAHGRAMSWTTLSHVGLARIHALRGETDAALAESQFALSLAGQIPGLHDLRLEPRVWLVHSAVLLQNGDVKLAREWAVRAREAVVRYYEPSSEAIKEANAAVTRAMAAAI